jgi:hypothetical protein
MKLPEKSFDLFLMNLKMIEKMINQSRQNLNNNEALDLQVMMLQKLINNLKDLQNDLKELIPSKTIN